MSSIESNVRSYSLAIPATFKTAKNAILSDFSGQKYIDFLSGCGSLNYGHNHDKMKHELIEYIENDGVAMSLDLHTTSKESFLSTFDTKILKPRNLEYAVQFTGPTGTNAVEAAIKLARKITKRTNIIAFTNAFHGCSLGALSLTGNNNHRESSSALLGNVTRIPFDGYFRDQLNSADMLEALLSDKSSGVDLPAAIIFECIQGEGGLNRASSQWAQKISLIAKKFNIPLIIDEIQTGSGRCGSFFAFEQLGIKPDIITLAKSISGFGLPMSLVLINPKLDQWSPGEHNGTFRGNNHAFVTAKTALDIFWSDDELMKRVSEKSILIKNQLAKIIKSRGLPIKGAGLMLGVELFDPNYCKRIKNNCYQNNLIIESSGAQDSVLKIMPPLTIENDVLIRGLEIIENAIIQEYRVNMTLGNLNKEVA